MFARRRDALQRESERIGALGVRGDVALPGDLERLVTAPLDAVGGIDTLVGNRGAPPAGKAVEIDDERLEAAFESLLLAAVRLVRLCLPYLEQSDAGPGGVIHPPAPQEP